MTSDNIYTTHQSVASIKSVVTSFELLKFGGDSIKLSNLTSGIDIYFYPSGLETLNYTLVNLSATTDSPMFYIQLRLNETIVKPVLVLQPEDVQANITYYIKREGIPTVHNYDMMGGILDKSEFEETSRSYIVTVDSLWSDVAVLPTELYIGLVADYSKFMLHFRAD